MNKLNKMTPNKVILGKATRPVKIESKYHYMIDLGHGGINPDTEEYVTKGKRSPVWPDGTVYYEGVGNREIGALIKTKLTRLKVDHSFSVDPENWRDTALSYRVKLANKAHSKKKTIFFSIHSNGASIEQAHGYEVWTSKGQTASDEFAEILFEEYGKSFPELRARRDTRDGDSDKESSFYVLKNTNGPAVLLETMFHTNFKECKMLMDPVVQERIAQAVVNTILRIERED